MLKQKELSGRRESEERQESLARSEVEQQHQHTIFTSEVSRMKDLHERTVQDTRQRHDLERSQDVADVRIKAQSVVHELKASNAAKEAEWNREKV